MTAPRSIDSRLRKLEAGGTGEIAIWCDDPSAVAATISEMIAERGLREVDRPHCVHWTAARRSGHERVLAELT
jgi:TusA-related sulfurtransferase